MKKLLALGAVAFVASAACGSANAAIFDFTFTSGTYLAASGQITTADTANADGGFDVLGITGTIEGNAISGLDGSGAELFPADPAKLVDETGITVDVPGAFLASPYTIFYGPEDLGDPVGTVDYQLGTPFFGSLGGSFTISADIPAAVPEPATWAMMVAGFGLVGAGMRRRVRPAVQAV